MRNGETTEPALNEKNAIGISDASEMLDSTVISEIRRILAFLAEAKVKIQLETLEEYEKKFAEKMKVEESTLEFAKSYENNHSSNNPISNDYFEQLRECLHQLKTNLGQLEEIVKKL